MIKKRKYILTNYYTLYRIKRYINLAKTSDALCINCKFYEGETLGCCIIQNGIGKEGLRYRAYSACINLTPVEYTGFVIYIYLC